MEVVPNIFLVKLPLPSKIGHVNCYLLQGGNGWSIIDTGLNHPASNCVWEQTLTGLNIKYGDIEGIYVSHMHPGHYGASGWLQELTGAQVYMSRCEIEKVQQTWKKGRTSVPVVGELLKENGIPAVLLTEVLDSINQTLTAVQPHPDLSPLPEGGEVTIGGRGFEVVKAPGHSDGHISFFCRDEGILFSGDNLLSPDSSGISLWPTSHPNPLELFLTSLELQGGLPVNIVLPGHGSAFSDCAGRVADLKKHYRLRLDRVAQLAGTGATAYQICLKLLGENTAPGEMLFLLTETLAHLAYLESKSRVTSRLECGVVTYRKAE